jgi:sugar phosphate permease
MLSRLWGFFRQAPLVPRLTDEAIIEKRYRQGRNHVLYGSMVGYGLFYFCRNSLSVGLPLLSRDLGYSNDALGMLGALFFVTYGFAKFGGGLLADRAHPRTFLLTGLLLSAAVNLWFGLTSSLVLLCALWCLNGLFQGTGAPASAKILATWFGAGERGTKTGIWNISHQGGGGLVLIIAGLFATYFGWRGAFIGPALLAIVGGLLIARFLHDRPEAQGLPPIDEYRHEIQAHDIDANESTFGHMFLHHVLLNWRVWIVALASCCTYIVRYGALGWAPKYLFEVRELSIGRAGLTSSLLELIGIPGALLCGWLSDRFLGARRSPVVFVSLVLLAGSVWLLFRVPPGRPALDALVLAAIGFFTYGPQMLLAGVSPVDMSSRRVAAAAVGFTGLMSYLGAAISSRVTGRLLDAAGWHAAFNFWIVAALAGAALCIPLWNESAVKRPQRAQPARVPSPSGVR